MDKRIERDEAMADASRLLREAQELVVEREKVRAEWNAKMDALIALCRS